MIFGAKIISRRKGVAGIKANPAESRRTIKILDYLPYLFKAIADHRARSGRDFYQKLGSSRIILKQFTDRINYLAYPLLGRLVLMRADMGHDIGCPQKRSAIELLSDYSPRRMTQSGFKRSQVDNIRGMNIKVGNAVFFLFRT